MATVSITSNRNVVTAEIVAGSGEHITSVTSWTWYKNNAVYAIHYTDETSDSIKIDGTGDYRVVCGYRWSETYVYYEKAMSSYGTASFNPEWQYLMYDDWDVDYDTGAVILGNPATDYLQNLEGYYTAAGRQVDDVHIALSSYEYTKYAAQAHTGTRTGTSSEHSSTIHVIFDPTAGNCFILTTDNGTRSWKSADIYIVDGRGWRPASDYIFDGEWK